MPFLSLAHACTQIQRKYLSRNFIYVLVALRFVKKEKTEKLIHFIVRFPLSWAKSVHLLNPHPSTPHILNPSSGPLYLSLRFKAKTSKE